VEDLLRRLLAARRYDRVLELLHRQYATDVARYVRRRRGKGSPDASVEDVCQETWASVHRSLPSLDPDRSIRSWLFSIAARRDIDGFRARRKELLSGDQPSEQHADAADRLMDPPLPVGPEPPSTPHTRMVHRARAQALARVLSRYDADDRELLEMRLFNELTPDEIVEICGLTIKPNSVEQRLLRLLSKLRRDLLKESAFASRKGR
jgi:RNA polymerase sigma-70 factor (ECF subfamily)